MRKIVLSLATDESGASAAEYAVLLTIVTLGMIAGVQALGSVISSVFRNVATTLTRAA